MDEPIIISTESDKPKLRAPPARFAKYMNNKQKEDEKQPEVAPVSKDTNSKSEEPPKIRRAHPVLYKDADTPCSLEDAVTKLTSFCPEFEQLKSTIDNGEKWQDKVEAFNKLIEFTKANGKDHPECGEALVVYACNFSKNFKAANMNILKCSLDCIFASAEYCGLGPRVTGNIVSMLIPKIHDRKLGDTISELFMVLAEGVGPKTVIAFITEGIASSKVAPQQKAAVLIIHRFVNEFGASALDIKKLMEFMTTNTCLQNSRVEVKNASIDVLCSLHKQIGEAIKSIITSSNLNELLKKTIFENMEKSPYDPTLLSKYTPIPISSSSSSQAPSTVSIRDLMEPYDLTPDLPPILKLLQADQGKEAWKERQKGIEQLTEIFNKNACIANNAAVHSCIDALRKRLTETNLNLVGKVLTCLAALAKSVGGEITTYSRVVMSDIIATSSTSNKNVSNALLVVLSSWVSHDDGKTATYVDSLLPYIPAGLKEGKGRALLLKWLKQWIPSATGNGCEHISAAILDCVEDRQQPVRSDAVEILVLIGNKAGKDCILENIGKMKPTKQKSILQTIGTKLDSCPTRMQNEKQKASPVITAASIPASSTEDEKKEEKSLEERKKALASRVGAHTLSRRTESYAESLKRKVGSSIPKPLPPLKRSRDSKGAPVPSPTPAPEPIVETPVVVEQEEKQEEFAFSAPVSLPQPAVKCQNLIGLLTTTNEKEVLMSTTEMKNCKSEIFEIPSSIIVGEFYSNFYQIMRILQEKQVVSLSTEFNEAYNACIESCCKLCWIAENGFAFTDDAYFQQFASANKKQMKSEIVQNIDMLLSVLVSVFQALLLCIQKNNAMEDELVIHLLNAITAVILCSSESSIHPNTVANLFILISNGISSFCMISSTDSSFTIAFLMRQLAYTACSSIPSIPLLKGVFQALEGIADKCGGNDETGVLLLFKRVLQFIAGHLKLDAIDEFKRNECANDLKKYLSLPLPTVLITVLNLCINKMEVSRPSITDIQSSILRSMNQLNSSPALTTPLTRTAMMTKVNLIRQQHEANKQVEEMKMEIEEEPKQVQEEKVEKMEEEDSIIKPQEEGKISVEQDELKEHLEVARKQDEHMKQIRERLSTLREKQSMMGGAK